MSNDHKRDLAEFIEDITTSDVPWANAATAFVAMKKRAAVEIQHVETGISDRAVGLMAHMVAEKFALQAEALSCGFDKMASAEREHARFFLCKLASARGTDWLLPEVPANKLSAMKERSITIMHHLCDELGDDPMRFTVGSFIDQDVGSLGKLASLDQVKEKRAAGAAVALVRVKQMVKQAAPHFLLHAIYRGNVTEAKKGRTALLKQGGPQQVDLASHDAYIKKHSSAISGGIVAGPDPSGMRPRHEYRDGAPYTYHRGKDEGQPRESKKTASNTQRLLETAFETGRGAAKRNAKRKAAREAAAKAAKVVAAGGTIVGGGSIIHQVSKESSHKTGSYRKTAVSAKWIGERVARGMKQRFGHTSGYKRVVSEGGATAPLYERVVNRGSSEAGEAAAGRLKREVPRRFQSEKMTAAVRAKSTAATRRKNLQEVTSSAGGPYGAFTGNRGKERITVGTIPKRLSRDQEPVRLLTRKKAALQVARIVKLAAEAGMSVQNYVGAEQQASQQMEQNELGHVRQVAEQATQQAQALSERALQAEQQLQGVQQQLQQSQQQGQMAMQQASESEANAAEQANAKLRMKMKIDQMRQTLADLAAVNPQMDEAPGPEAGMPQPGAPPGPVQQQADAAQQAAQQPQTAEQAKQMQQAQTAQNKAQEQTQQAQQAQQGQMGAAQVPLNAGAQGAPAVAPVTPPTV